MVQMAQMLTEQMIRRFARDPERSRHLEIHKKTRFLQHSTLKVSEFRGNCEGNKREYLRATAHAADPCNLEEE